MALNFMGLGFSFGAKDQGLEAAIGGLSQQFDQLNQSLKGFQNTAQQGMAPAADFVEGLQDQLGGIQKEASAGIDLSSAIDIGDWSDEAKDGLGGVDEALGGMKDEVKSGGTDFGRMANSVLGGAGKMTAAMGWVGLAIGPVIGGFGQAAESAGGMVDAVSGIPNRIGDQIHRIANEGINLTNSLEGEAVALGQTARQVGVNMGYTGQNLRRFIGQATGMAMGLNIGADEAARAIRGWDEASEDLAATGISSARDLARFTAGLGVNADILRNSTMELRNLGAEDEQIHLVTSALAQMGRETGDVAGALNELPQVIQMLERRRALGDTPEQMAAFAADTAAAARGLFEFTQDSDRAREMASSLAGTVTESREAFQNMFAGTEDQLPQLVTELSITQGEIDESFRLMQAGPGGLIEGMGQLVQSTRANNGDVGRLMEFMRGRLQQVFGPEMTATLINFWGTMDAETVQAMGAIRGASVDLGAMGREAHTTGRTMDEVFERMRAGFQTAMRAISRQDSRDFLRRTRESLGALRTSMQEAARSGGPLGDVMGLLSRSQQLGALALLPAELRGSAVAADELRGQIMPLVQAFTSWGGVMDTVLGYVGLFAADVVAAWGQIKRQARRAGQDLDPMTALGQAIDQQANRYAGILTNMIGKIENFVTRAVNAFANFDFGQLFAVTPEGQEDQGVMGAIRRVLNRLGEVNWGHIWSQLQKGFENLFNRVRPWLEQKVEQLQTIVGGKISEWWGAIDWDQVLSDIGGLISGLWDAVQPALSRLGDMITSWLGEHWGDIMMGAELALIAALGALVVGAIGAIVAWVAAPWVMMWMGLTEVIPAFWERFGDDITAYFEGLGDDLAEIWQFLVTSLGDYFEDLGEDLEEIWQYLGTVFSDIWDDVADWFRNLWNGIAGWFGRVWDRVTETVRQAVEDWRNVFLGIEEFFAGLGEGIRETLVGIFDWLTERWNNYVNNLQTVWNTVMETIGGFWDTVTSAAETLWETITGAPESIQSAWSGIVEFFTGLFGRLREALSPVTGIFERIRDVGTGALQSVMQAAVGLFGNSINTVIGEDMAATEAVMTETAERVSEVMQTVLHDATVNAIVTGFSSGFDQVVETMDLFSATMVEAFTEMGDSVADILGGLFETVISQAEIAMLAAETAVEGIIGRLRTVTEAQARLAAARGQAIASLARPADEAALRRRMAQLQGNEVLQAIHHPDWYGGIGGRGGYQQLFVAKMNELRDAMASAGTAGGTGTLEQRRRLITEAGERLARTRNAPRQPGLPGRGR